MHQKTTISILFSVPDTARAEILITAKRIYYQFSTYDTCEKGDFYFANSNLLISEIESILLDNSSRIMPTDVICNISIDNESKSIKYNNHNITHLSFNSIINKLVLTCDEFLFLRGFK